MQPWELMNPNRTDPKVNRKELNWELTVVSALPPLDVPLKN
jgi:hypothetical protein